MVIPLNKHHGDPPEISIWAQLNPSGVILNTNPLNRADQEWARKMMETLMDRIMKDIIQNPQGQVGEAPHIPLLFELEVPIHITGVEIRKMSNGTKNLVPFDISEERVVEIYWDLLEQKATGEVRGNPFLWTLLQGRVIKALKGSGLDLYRTHLYIQAVEKIFGRNLDGMIEVIKTIWNRMGSIMKVIDHNLPEGTGIAPDGSQIHLDRSGSDLFLSGTKIQRVKTTQEGIEILIWQTILQTLLGKP